MYERAGCMTVERLKIRTIRTQKSCVVSWHVQRK